MRPLDLLDPGLVRPALVPPALVPPALIRPERGKSGLARPQRARGGRQLWPAAPGGLRVWRGVLGLVGLALLAGAAGGCRDLSSYSTGSGSDLGSVVVADFVRSGIEADAGLCLTLDTNHLQDTPGTLSTSDGMFEATPMRPIPQIWQDPLSTFNFGEGRVKNLLYVATPQPDSGSPGDVMVVVSLMSSGGVEIRLLRGAPALSPDGGMLSGPTNLFAVFPLTHQSAPCPF